MILFLDFDGVLHPDPCDRRDWFCQLPLLENVLRQHPHVDVVISSSWRYDHSLEQLRGTFAEDLRSRIVGVTPTDARPQVEDWMPQALLPSHHREIECRKWLQRYRSTQTHWLAIDDVREWFAPDCKNLLVTDSGKGFRPEQVEFLEKCIKDTTG
ncbi:HAD domain-containing protein [Rhodoferax sp. GW822-FHT02A01]|uniref:HAD domain-containing protein n=1 Tax=Rhodoferax sp. GW822-FHT02A01 TaxID=3141537 RepID=UPI00315CA766